MHLSDFWRLMEDEFGSSYARSLASSHVLHALGDQTAIQALDSGAQPRGIWVALCEDMDVPPERRLGRDARASRSR